MGSSPSLAKNVPNLIYYISSVALATCFARSDGIMANFYFGSMTDALLPEQTVKWALPHSR